MKTLLLITAILFAFGANGQDSTKVKQPTQMKAVKVETSVDPKFERMTNILNDAEKQVRHLIASETLLGGCKNEALTIEYLDALKAVQKAYRDRFMSATQVTIEVDSLQYRQELANDSKELNRLKAAINAGQDSTILQPKVNSMKNRINEKNKIIKSWVKVVIVK
jgi:hypothetical protein